jgi:hypothetical protein
MHAVYAPMGIILFSLRPFQDSHSENVAIPERSGRLGGPTAKDYCWERYAKAAFRRRLPSSLRFLRMARPARFERATFRFGGEYSIQLSYGRNVGVAILLAVAERRPASQRQSHSLGRRLQFEDGGPIARCDAGAGDAGKGLAYLAIQNAC